MIVGDRAAESFSLETIGPRLIQGCLCRRYTLQADQGAGEIKTGHHLFEAHSFIADYVFRRHLNIIEEDGAAPDHAGADILEGRAADPRLIEINQEGGNPTGAVFLRAGAGKEDTEVGLMGHGYRGFLAVQDIDVALAFRLETDIRGVGARTRLGESEAGGSPTATDIRDHRGRHLTGAMIGNDPGVQSVQKQDVADIKVFPRQFLHHDAFGDEVLAEAAELLRQRRAD